MVRVLGLVSGSLWAIAMPLTAQAQQVGITYDCDTAADHYSELVLPAPATPFVVTGQVKLMRVANTKEFAPLTRLLISGDSVAPGRSADNSAGFTLMALPGKSIGLKSVATARFLNWSERAVGQDRKHDPIGPLQDSEPVPFRLRFDGTTVTGEFGGRVQTMALTTKTPVVRVICSTGEFLYTELKIEPAP